MPKERSRTFAPAFARKQRKAMIERAARKLASRHARDYSDEFDMEDE